jgi:hypothetical protein
MLDNVGELGDVIFSSVVVKDSLVHEGAGMLSQIPEVKKSPKSTDPLKSATDPNKFKGVPKQQ